MKLLVTGGAGFIGANFVHYTRPQPPRVRGRRARRAHLRRQPREPEAGRGRDRVRARRHLRPPSSSTELRRGVRHGRALRGRVARRQLAARPGAVHPDQRDRHLHDPRGGPQARRAAAPHLHRRGLRRPRPRRRRPVHRGDAVRPVEPVLGDQGRLGPARAGLGALVRHPRHALELRQQLRALPARREVHPAPDHQRAWPARGRSSTARARTCASGPTSTTTTRPST